MVRKIAGIILFLILIMGCVEPALAAQKRMQSEEKPLWRIIADSFKDFKIREQDKIKGLDKVGVFQDVGDGIKNYKDTARDQSLRDK